MPNDSLDQFLKLHAKNLLSPIAVILAEDGLELESTVKHHHDLGFKSILVIGAIEHIDLEKYSGAYGIAAQLNRTEESIELLNQIIKATTDKWLYYCFNAEYLFFPHSETRTIQDIIMFVEEERRAAVFTYAIDIYSQDLSANPNGVDLGTAQLDSSGYYGTELFDGPETVERQTEIYGGLRWRFEEHIPWEKRRIDRIALFKSEKDLVIGADMRLSVPEMNTVSCEWHNNLTIAVMSFRVAKALMHNPGSAEKIGNFNWAGSQKFEWNSKQLLELGFIEPGQWF